MFLRAKPNLQYEQGWKTRESKFWFDVDNDVRFALFAFCLYV